MPTDIEAVISQMTLEEKLPCAPELARGQPLQWNASASRNGLSQLVHMAFAVYQMSNLWDKKAYPPLVFQQPLVWLPPGVWIW